MKRKYSVFLGNVGSCSDRYCPEYAKPFSTAELFDRAASVPLIRGVDLVASPGLLDDRETVREKLREHKLKAVSVAADTFTQARWKQGSFSAPDPEIRKQAMLHAEETIAFAKELDCSLVTFWPGQDGYDYPFQADYERERGFFIDALKTLCREHPETTFVLEYKMKEPRTHSYLNTVAMTVLFCQAAGPNCKAVIDFGHALLGYENPAESVAILHQFGNLLRHIHINDNYRLWDDDMIVGTVHTLEYLEFFYWLRRTGYDGWFVIDQFPYREDGLEAVAESAKWLDFLETIVDHADFEEIAGILQKKDAVSASKIMRKLLRNRGVSQ